MQRLKKIGTMDLILIIVAAFLLTFVVIMLVMYYLTGGIPDTLCTCVFGFCGGECGIMGWIKTTKDKHGVNSIAAEEDSPETIDDETESEGAG